MNIRQALYQNLKECTVVDESYYGKIMVQGTQKTYYPVDFRLRKGAKGYRLNKDDLYFQYKLKEEKTNITKGEYVLNKYYPISSVLTIENLQFQIQSYGEPVTVAGATRVPIYTKCINDDNMIQVVTNNGVEDRVKRELQNILFSNDELKRLLPYYKHNWLDYTEENISSYIKALSLKRLFDIRTMEDVEYNYRLNNTFMALDLTTFKQFSDEHKEFMERYNYEKVKIILNETGAKFNLISIVKWFLYYRDFRKDDMYITNAFNENVKLNIYPGVDKSVIIELKTPASAVYDYRIELINVVRCNINKTYYEYVMDNIRVYSINKCKCNPVSTEIINLTGEGSENISKLIKRLRPSRCLLTNGSCINNCVPGNCSALKPGSCINICENYQDIEDNKQCDCGTIDVLPGDSFDDTFFTILCELIRHICASEECVKSSSASCSDEYYGLLNNILVELINKFKEEVTDPDDFYCNTAEEFKAKYHELLTKTTESITLDDEETINSAIDEYDHLPDDEKDLLVDERTLLNNFVDAILILKINNGTLQDVIVVDNIDMRNSIPSEDYSEGMIVKVEDNGDGNPAYYRYVNGTWILLELISGDGSKIDTSEDETTL